MLFTSEIFLFLFLPTLMILYFLIPNRFLEWKNWLLLVFSLVFYSWGKSIYVFLLLFEIIIVWISGRFLVGNVLENKESTVGKRIVLICSITVILGFLVFFKYANFIILNINTLFHVNLKMSLIELPLGISFFSFQMISYMIDCYWGKIQHKSRFVDVALYVSMFPQLVAGPIVRYTDIEMAIHNRQVSMESFGTGIQRFLTGLAKKVLIANQLAYIAEFSWGGVEEYSLVALWLGAIAYSLQILFDFSGYSDMAIGLGKVFGFDFPENFNYPYIASSVTDFWRRWHMSLSGWFRDYVYIPLGGNRKGKLVEARNLFVVWLLTGIWHGANWTFVCWGLLYFVLIAFEKLINRFEHKYKIISHLYTIVVVNFLWVIFSADNMIDAVTYIRNMLFVKNGAWIDGSVWFILRQWWVTYIIAIFFCVPTMVEKVKRIKRTKAGLVIYDIARCIMILLTISYIVKGSYNPFIYFSF